MSRLYFNAINKMSHLGAGVALLQVKPTPGMPVPPVGCGVKPWGPVRMRGQLEAPLSQKLGPGLSPAAPGLPAWTAGGALPCSTHTMQGFLTHYEWPKSAGQK